MLSNEPVIPSYTLESLEDYVLNGNAPGGFLTAVLKNDLSGAIRNADSKNRAAITTLHDFLFNYTPHNCWKSEERFRRWTYNGGFTGIHSEADAEKVRERFRAYEDEHYETA